MRNWLALLLYPWDFIKQSTLITQPQLPIKLGQVVDDYAKAALSVTTWKKKINIIPNWNKKHTEIRSSTLIGLKFMEALISFGNRFFI